MTHNDIKFLVILGILMCLTCVAMLSNNAHATSITYTIKQHKDKPLVITQTKDEKKSNSFTVN